MTYFADLTTYRYARYPDEQAALNIGWLSGTMPYDSGDVPPEFVERLAAYCTAHLFHLFFGYHECEFCFPDGPRTSYSSREEFFEAVGMGDGEIRVPGVGGRVYAAPAMIYHYVAEHHYRPPDEFIDAVLNAPLPGSAAYKEMVGLYEQQPK